MIYIDQRANGNFGIGRFSAEIGKRSKKMIPFRHSRSPFSFIDPFTLHTSLPAQLDFFVSTNISGPVLSRIPYAVCVHDLVQLDLPHFFSVITRIYIKFITGFIVKRAAIVFTVSNFSKKRIIHHFGIADEKIVVLGNAAGDLFRPNNNKPLEIEKFFFNYSSKKNYKNLSRIITSYLMIKEHVPENLIIVGAEKSIVSRFSKYERILFIDQISDKELVNYLQTSSATVFTSLYEGFGIPIIEAMACGSPVITSNVAAMPEVAGGAAILVDPKNCQSIADAMLLISKMDAKERFKMIDAGLNLAERYSWDRLAEVLSESVDSYISKLKKKAD